MNESNKNEFRILNIINEKYSYNLKGSTIDDFIQGNFSITITRKEFDLLFTEAINKTKEFIKNFPKLDIYKIILLYFFIRQCKYSFVNIAGTDRYFIKVSPFNYFLNFSYKKLLL